MHPFRQDSNFAYLTGVQEPGFAVAIDSETGFTVLLVPYLNPDLVVWMGAQPSLDDLAELYGADSCALLTDLNTVISHGPFKDAPIHILQAKDRQTVQQYAPQVAQNRCKELPALQQAVTACRAIKTDADIACLHHASDVSAGGHVAMWRWVIWPVAKLLQPLSLNLAGPTSGPHHCYAALHTRLSTCRCSLQVLGC